MLIERKGITRIVLVFDTFVIKIPNFTYCWGHFLQGLISNINENKTWKYHPKKELLCPIIWSSWGGWILVMKKAIPCKWLSKNGEKIDYSKWIICGLGGDDKPENYGILNNGVVKIDYGSLN